MQNTYLDMSPMNFKMLGVPYFDLIWLHIVVEVCDGEQLFTVN
jgi:hypothetical protein